MGVVISIENPKGGAGKSTTATNLARGLQMSGATVLLVDRDPNQGTAREWSSKNDIEGYPMVVSINQPTLHVDIKKISDKFDYIIVDGASKLEEMLASSVRAADIIIIPVQPSVADVDGCADLVSLIKQRQMVTDGKPQAYFLVTREKKQTKLAAGIQSALDRFELPTFESRISDSVLYTEALGNGLTVYEDTTGAGRSKVEEINNLISELRGRINV